MNKENRWLTLSQASHHFGSAMQQDTFAGSACLREALLNGTLAAFLREPAPDHTGSGMAGQVILDQEFWQKTWWLGLPSGTSKPSDEWVAWMLAGGVVVSLNALDCIAAPLIVKANARIAESNRLSITTGEAYVRTNFQGLWPATDALAWIVTRTDASLAKIRAGIDPLGPDDFIPPATTLRSIADEQSEDGDSGWQLLRAAVEELSRACRMEKLKAWEWGPALIERRASGNRTGVARLSSDDFLASAYVEGTNSCGLLGIDLIGRPTHYVLFEPDEVRALWVSTVPPIAAEGISAVKNDEWWWTWPEAIAWVESREFEKVVSVRQAAAQWAKGGDQAVAIAAQLIMAGGTYPAIGAAIRSEIEHGTIETMGREKRNTRFSQLPKEIWHGSEVANGIGMADLVNARDKTVFAYDVVVRRTHLMKAFPAPGPAYGATVPVTPGNRPRELDHPALLRQAEEMRVAQPTISLGSAAASIVADLPPNPKTGKPRDTRGIERIIQSLWAGIDT